MIKHLKGSIFRNLLLYSLVCSHFIIQLGRDESIFEFLTSPWYYLDMGYTVAINLMLWSYIYVVFIGTQEKYPIQTALIPGLIRQFCLSLLLPVLLVILIAWGYKRWVWEENIQESGFFLYEFYFVVVLILLFNLFLYTRALWQQLQQGQVHTPPVLIGDNNSLRESIVEEQPEAEPQTLLVASGEKVVVLNLSDIALCQLEQSTVFIHTMEGKHYRYSGTLEKLEKLLPPAQFYRLNRQHIVKHDNCLHYVVQRSGKIELSVKHGTAEPLIISQKRAGDFKIWIRKTLTSA
ncbi:LytTR family DNA-binding domain-containing protein [Cesiribacter sp. SM1]|uniref:LytR/AlgR family response regulator transcription factor n=1 Tax=Cesiribacter sp. SM1 TaxID=2861196 RepID=UPI001CD49191|nr:LytTR family DNA-binding domain-containing protein [Cesiribacter sp. SM1]